MSNTYPKIQKGLKVFDFKICEYRNRPIVKGKYINQSIYFIKNVVGDFSVGEKGHTILFFPSLNIQISEQDKIIEPFEEGEFCHFISEEEIGFVKEAGTTSLKLYFLEFDRSQNKG